MRAIRAAVTLGAGCIWLFSVPSQMLAIDLGPETLNAWDAYVKEAQKRTNLRLNGGHKFLWTDDSAARKKQVQAGEIVVEPVGGNGRRGVPEGLIHDWIGAAFIPNATLDDLWAVLHDYDHYKDYYEPTVVASKLLSHDGNDYKFTMTLLKTVLFVTAAYEGEYDSQYFRLSENRATSWALSLRMYEIQHFGEPGQIKLPDGQGSGFLWRLYSISRYEQRDNGVYAELEAIGLTRDVPLVFRWLVNPVIGRLSKSSLYTSLDQTRKAVLKKKAAEAPAAGRPE